MKLYTLLHLPHKISKEVRISSYGNAFAVCNFTFELIFQISVRTFDLRIRRLAPSFHFRRIAWCVMFAREMMEVRRDRYRIKES